MKSLKKSVIAVLVIGTLSVAGTAFAYRGQGNGQAGPAGYFGGHHQMIRQQWNGNNLPPAPWAGNGNTCCCGQTAPSQGLGHMGSPRQGRGFAPAFGNPGWQGSRGGHFDQRGQFFTDIPQEIRDKEAEREQQRLEKYIRRYEKIKARRDARIAKRPKKIKPAKAKLKRTKKSGSE